MNKHLAKSFRAILWFVMSIGVAGCEDKSLVYQLDSISFDEASLEMVAARTGIVFPHGTKGVHLAYFGDGIDPFLFAKVEIPESEHDAFEQQLDKLPDRRGGIVIPRAKKVDWWESVSEDHVLLTRLFDHHRNGVQVKYCLENDRWYLYMLWVKT